MDDPIKASLQDVNRIGVLQTLANALPYLSETERRLVMYILSHPKEASEMAVSDLVAAAGVSSATLFRLCRDLGFGGLSALRKQLSHAVGAFGENFCAPVGSSYKTGPQAGSLLQGAYVGMRVLLDACAVPQDRIDAAVRAICDAGRLSFAGMGGISARIAEIALFTFQRLGFTCMLWTDAQVTNAPRDVFTSEDVLIAISHSGENAALAEFVKAATDSGATTVALTNYSRSALASSARLVLATGFREDFVGNYDLLPRLSQLLLLQLLFDGVRKRRSASRG